MAALSQEKVYLVAAAAFALGSAAFCGTMIWRHTQAPQAAVATVELADTPYAASVAEAAIVKTDNWNPPSSQSRGRDWVYDTFTPPEIFYNSRNKTFTVKPPAAVSEDLIVEEAFGLELASVRPEPFRLQLIGYVGGDGHERGTFENLGSGEVFLATSGHRVPKLGLTIKSFNIRSVEVKSPGNMTTRQRIATAVVLDEKIGREVTLTHRERQFTGGLTAFVAKAGESATREVRAGESFSIGEVTYRIDSIKLTPPTIEVIKESPSLTQPDRRILTPREAEESASADALPQIQ